MFDSFLVAASPPALNFPLIFRHPLSLSSPPTTPVTLTQHTTHWPHYEKRVYSTGVIGEPSVRMHRLAFLLQDFRNKTAQGPCIFEVSCPCKVPAKPPVSIFSLNKIDIRMSICSHFNIFLTGSQLTRGGNMIFFGLRSGIPQNSPASNLLLSSNLRIFILICLKSVTDRALGLSVFI